MSLVAVVRRELIALAMNPYTYVVASAYLVISGIFFAATFLSTRLPDLERYFSNIGATLVVLVPLVASRSFADERRTGVLDLQMSWPVARWKLAVGKFAANTTFLIALVSVMWVYVRHLSVLTDIEVGKSVAEYLGLVLLVVSFSGIAHAISARSSTTPGAAFLGFGALLTLWVIDVIPGWLGNASIAGFRLNSLAPTLRLEPFGRGVVTLHDTLFFLGLAVGGVALAAQAISDRRPRTQDGIVVWLRTATAWLATGAVVVGLFVGAAQVRHQWDLTPTARFTVSALTETQVVDALDEVPVVTAFLERGSAQEVAVRSLIASYEAAGAEIDAQFVDPDVQPSMAKRYDINFYGQALIQLGDRTERVESLSEVSLTSALVRLLQPRALTACFTVGHGERDIAESRLAGLGQFASELRKSGFEVQTLAVAAEGGVERLDACDVVVVAGPHVAFLDGEIRALRDWVEDDGRLIVMAPEDPEVRSQFNDEILRDYGLAFGEGFVTDVSSLRDDPAAVVAFDYPSQSPATEYVKQHEIPTVFSGAVPIGIDPGAAEVGHLSTLAQSSDASGTDVGGAGPLVLAALSDHSELAGAVDELAIERTRIAAIGTADIATNEFFQTLGNRDFVLRLTQWVAREDDLVAAATPPGGVREVPVTDDQRTDLIIRTVAIPALVPLPLAALVARRRRRG